eukprot:m.94359 g.94359  ORF g.94359 m.94359 type:complete len:579 (-) comp13023_c0_seq1:23488-25224(-)
MSSEETVDVAAPAEAAPVVFNVPALAVVGIEQRQHGLRHADYTRYRQYVTRKLHRMRKALKVPQGKHKFSKRPITVATVTDERHLMIPLFLADRAWAYFHEDKDLTARQPAKAYHGHRRLTKAVTFASQFNSLVQQDDRCTPATKAEAKAYFDWLQAVLRFEEKQWKKANALFSAVLKVYQGILSTVDNDEMEQIYQQRISEIQDSIRFCIYNSGGKAISSDMSSESRPEETLEVSWVGRTVPVKARKLRTKMLEARVKEEGIDAMADDVNEAVMLAKYDDVFIDYADALEILTNDLQELERKHEGMMSDDIEQQLAVLNFLKSYLQYRRLTYMLQRNMRMVRRTLAAEHTGDAEPESLVRLFDIVSQNVVELSNIELLQNDPTFQRDSKARSLYFRAMRCYNVGHVYQKSNKYREALAMYELAVETALTAIPAVDACSNPDFEDFKANLNEVLQSVRTQKCAMKASAYIKSLSAKTASTGDAQVDDLADQIASTTIAQEHAVPLVQDLDSMDSSSQVLRRDIVTFPPNFQPLHTKPLFFDVAANHLAFPDVSSRTQPQKASGSMFSAFSSLWGGSSS